ncbi:MAG: MMPL family transporter, partial [Methylococcales bacterium]
MPANSAFNLLDLVLRRISSLAVLYPWKILAIAILFTGYSVYFITEHLGVNTDTSAMLSPDLPYQVNIRKLITAFPQDQDTIVMLVEGQTPEQAKLIAEQLYTEVAAKSKLFEYPYSPGNSKFFQQQGLLYLDLNELENLTTNLSKAQPFLGKLARNYTLNGFFPILTLALESSASGEDLPIDLSTLLTEVHHALAAVSENQTYPLSWQTMMFGDTTQFNQKQQLVIVKPVQDFNQLLPAGESMDFLRTLTSNLQTQHHGSKIQITGPIALDHEELETALSRAALSAVLALTLIVICLYFGLRSYKMVIATFIILITGLIWTTAFAAAAIGQLNMISLSFAVLYIGLGVDYAIHYCLRYQEASDPEFNPAHIQRTTNSIGKSLMLCAITTSIGFFAFIPTDFLGVSELGIIAGAGIFIGLLVSLTILPALLCVLRVDTHNSHANLPAWIIELPIKQHQTIKALSLLAAIFSLILISKLQFDPDPINLKAPDSESVIAFKQLQHSEYFSPLTITALTNSAAETHAVAHKLQQLNVAKDVITLFDFVPDDQDEKLEMIDNLALLVGTDIQRLTNAPDQIHNTDSILEFKQAVDRLIVTGKTSIDIVLLKDLQSTLNTFLSQVNGSADPKQPLGKLQDSLLGYLPPTMSSLASGLNAEPVSLSSIPDYLRERWLSPEQVYKVEILPRKALTTQTDLHNFVRDIQAV